MAIQADLKSESPHPIEASLGALSPVLAEYSEALGVSVRIEVPHCGGDHRIPHFLGA